MSVWLAGALIALAVQWYGAAWDAGFGSMTDEPGHAVSSIAIRQYLRQGLWRGQSPPEFLAEFNQRFPRVSIGHWPPVLYVVEGLWLSVAPLNRQWMLMPVAIAAGLAALFSFLLGYRAIGLRCAAAAAIAGVLVPTMTRFERVLMGGVPLAAATTAALVAYARFVRTRGSLPSASLFAATGSAAILTKPGGALLGLLPPLHSAVFRRWDLVANRGFLLAAALAALLCLPWYLAFYQDMETGWGRSARIARSLIHIPLYNLRHLLSFFTLAGFSLAVLGAWQGRARVGLQVASCGVIAAWLFHAVVHPTNEHRHYVAVAPALALLVAAGCRMSISWFRCKPGRLIWAFPAIMALWSATLPPKPASGIDRLVERLLADPKHGSVWLVSATKRVDGDLITEAAMRRPSAGLTVYRAMGLLPEYPASGDSARERGSVMNLVEQCRIRTIVLLKDADPQLEHALVERPERWQRSGAALPRLQVDVYTRLGDDLPALGEPLRQLPWYSPAIPAWSGKTPRETRAAPVRSPQSRPE